MTRQDRSDQLRRAGLMPTIQRLAIMDFLDKSKMHPTADQVLLAVRKRFPSISRATVYNTLEALTRVGLILRITVDPSVARYDADLEPHVHFRCRECQIVYDVSVEDENTLGEEIDGHAIEVVRTYAYGVCSSCLPKITPRRRSETGSSNDSPSEEGGG